MDEELLRLQQELEEVQLEDTEQRLSEKNVVTIILKLVQLKQVELVYTLTGKEYLTPKQLVLEIEDELTSRGGRLRLDDISASLNIDIISIENAVAKLVSGNDEIFLLNSIEVITSWYIDNVSREWNEYLQEKGQVTIGEIATKYNLPVDVVAESIKERIGTEPESQIRAERNGNVLYTEFFVDQQRSMIRGLLMATTQPVSLSRLATKYSLEATMTDKLVREMINNGMVPGCLGGGDYVPFIFTVMQRSKVDSFFASNNFIDLKMLKSLKVKSGPKFVQESFPDAILLDSCMVGATILSSLEAIIDECIANNSVADIKSAFPAQLNDKDCSLLLSKVTVLKSRKKAKAKVFANRYVASNFFLETLELEFKTLSLEAGKIAGQSRPSSNKAKPKPKPIEKDAEKKTQKKGKKGKGRRQRGNVSDTEDDNNRESAVDTHFTKSLEQFLQESSLTSKLKKANETLAANPGISTEFVSDNLSKARKWFTESYGESVAMKQRGGEAKRRSLQGKLEKEFQTIYPTFRVFANGLIKMLSEFNSSPAQVLIKEFQDYYVNSIGFNLIGILLEYSSLNFDINFSPENREQGEAAQSLRDDVEHCRSIVNELPNLYKKKYKVLYAFLLKGDSSLADFLTLLEDIATGDLEIVLQNLDKKSERNLVFGHKKDLFTRLNSSKASKEVVVLSMLMVFLKSGTFPIPLLLDSDGIQESLKLLPVLKEMLGDEKFRTFSDALSENLDVSELALNSVREIALE